MKLNNLVGDRFKETPSDCVIDSHALMLRGAYMKNIASGIFSSYLPLRKITRKIEQIIREEMNLIDGQEVLFPVVLPASLWQESGRYETVGNELVRLNDRNNAPLVLGMTHEEAAVHLVREYGKTYNRYPFMIYQIQTKFRDEARPRGGLIRVREFTMKDAYSFHTSQDDLEKYYERCFKAYERIFSRIGLSDVISISSDSGMMGGNISHEFMLLSDIGEDSIVLCKECDYKVNSEAAENISYSKREDFSHELNLVHTPNMNTIEDICNFFNLGKEKSCKAVVYQKNTDDSYVILFIRGDMEVNETKLTNYLACDIRPAVITKESGLHAGYTGPYNLNTKHLVLFDKSLENSNNLICGGNIDNHHYTGLDITRDIGDIKYNDFAKIKEGGICPKCKNQSVTISKGIELGNIFQLGTKYTKAMNMQYTDKNGASGYPLMGCYGIGIERLAASVCEAHHDDYGPIWPMSIAPWQVHICAMRAEDTEVKNFADNLYNKLQEKGIEVIYDDRNVSAGIMFSDADLLGVPIRVIVSPRNIKENCCEIVKRDKSLQIKEPLESVLDKIYQLIK